MVRYIIYLRASELASRPRGMADPKRNWFGYKNKNEDKKKSEKKSEKKT